MKILEGYLCRRAGARSSLQRLRSQVFTSVGLRQLVRSPSLPTGVKDVLTWFVDTSREEVFMDDKPRDWIDVARVKALRLKDWSMSR